MDKTERAVVLFGTVTCTAENLAYELVDELQEAGLEAEAADMMDARADFFEEVREENRAVVVCVATHGDGELPPDAMDFYEALREERPDLSGVAFCVCGLGDSAYEDFCEAGRFLSRFLAELGGREVMERHEIDGFVGEEEIAQAREWTVRAAATFKESVPEYQGEGRQ